MTSPNFGLLGLRQVADPGERFQQGFELGAVRNALSQFAESPDQAIAGAMPYNPALGLRLQGQQQRGALIDQRVVEGKQEQEQLAQQQQRQSAARRTAVLARANEGNYEALRGYLQSNGLAEGVPEAFDPNYIQQQQAIFEATQAAGDRETRVIGDSLVDARTGEVVFQNPYVTVRDANGQTIIVPRQQIDSYYGQRPGSMQEGRTGTINGRRITVRNGVPTFDDTGEPVPPEQRGPASAPGGFQ